MQTMMQLNYNPKGVLLGPGGSFQFFANIFGPAMEGVMFEGAWSVNSSPDAKAYYDKLKAFMGSGDNIDFWGAIIYRAELEFFQQAIEKAGTLNQDKIAEVMRTEHFKTVHEPDTFYTQPDLRHLFVRRPDRPVAERGGRGHRRGREAHGRSHLSQAGVAGGHGDHSGASDHPRLGTS